MLRFVKFRNYLKTFSRNEHNKLSVCEGKEKINFKSLKHISKVPALPVTHGFDGGSEDIEIDLKTIQLLERLSLVDLDSKEALATLKSSIQFADKIVHIDTEAIAPLYTVLETDSLSLRSDHVTEGYTRGDVLRNAKVTDEDYFVSPPGNIPLQQEDNGFSKSIK